MRYGFVIDQRKCIGCHACSVACKAENHVSLGVHRTWVKYVEKGRFPDSRRFFQVTRCNHCANPPCVAICPVKAMYQRKDGIVDFDQTRCIGCKGCLQACPYDAIYIDPVTHTAAKCTYCAHRVEVAIEPACVTVCPEHAIVAGDLDQPGSEIAQLVSREQFRVRKPEQNTLPHVFYLAADEATISPTAASYENAYMWADRNDRIAGGGAIRMPPNRAIPAPVRAAYDVEHERPWDWRVPAYAWTKSIGAAVLAVPAVAAALGWLQTSKALNLFLVLLALVFTGLTALLLVSDLSRRERFMFVLNRAQGKSWIARGAYILIAYSVLCVLYGLAVLIGISSLSSVLLWLTVAGGGLAAIYTAWLFGQCEGRDLWQTPLLPLHMLVQGWLASAAVLALLAPACADASQTLRVAGGALALGLAFHLLTMIAEFLMPPATDSAQYAARLLTRGPFRFAFWAGAIVLGVLIPAVLLAVGWGQAGLIGWAAASALVGMLVYEWCFVMAGQGVPNS
ncbi:MAG TPA: 4Fe-4S dicluster domain-containing protein [Phycisphaerae bacterium]|nr:4Fe-4S dicluster domain-containing protein [Phycisphaerae bacterium]